MSFCFTRVVFLRNLSLFNKKSLFKKPNQWNSCKQTFKMYSTTETENVLTIKNVQEKLAKIMGIQKGVFNMVPGSKKDHLMEYLPTDLSQLEPRSMQDSFTTAIIPLSTNLILQDKYVSFLGTVRLGRLLEDMDLFAVWVVYQHIKNPLQKPDMPSPYTLVTALVDKIDFTGLVPKVDQDIRLSGHVSWVGKSSVEVVVWLEQMRNGKWEKITRALFLMAARNPLLTGPALLNPIHPANEREQNILAGGVQRKEKRLKVSNESLKKVIPNETEQQIIHNVFLSTMSIDDVSLTKLSLPPNSEWMENCKLTNIIISHPENRNFHNKVFGGFIMRNAFELSFALAYLHCKHIPKLKHISDVVFHKPVELSSLIRMTAYVVYTHKNYVQISVFAESTYKNPDKLSTTNELHFTFELNDPVTKVIPKSYLESMLYINGKRRLEEVVVEGNVVPDTLINTKL